eukprot:g29621.t1
MHTGGAVFVQGIFKQLDGRIAVANSSAALGGGIRCSWFLQYKGLLSVISRSTTPENDIADLPLKPVQGSTKIKSAVEKVVFHLENQEQMESITAMVRDQEYRRLPEPLAVKGGCITISQKRPTLDRLSRFSLAKFLNTLVETTGYDSKEVNELKEPGENRVAILGTTRFKGCNADIGGAIFSQGTVHLGKARNRDA